MYNFNRTLRKVVQMNIRNASSSRVTSGEYCLDLVRKHDHENFLSSLLLPSSVRASAFAIRAFNIEIANIQDSISDVRIGQMRMKFWEETLEKMYKDDVAKHPVANQLHFAVKKHKLSKRYLKRLISARENYLVSKTFENIFEMENYAEHTVSSLYYLILESAGIENVHADHVASHLGKAQGITNLIRSTFHNANLKIVTLPQDVLMENNVSHEQLFRCYPNDNLYEAVFSVAKVARLHLNKARSLAKSIPKEAAVVFLPAVGVESYLDRLQNASFNVFDPPLQRRNVLLPLYLYWKKIQSKY